jgi:hypothetical protein
MRATFDVVLPLALVAFAIAAWRARRLWSKRAAVIGLLWALFGDELYGRYELDDECHRDGKVRVFRAVRGVQSFYGSYISPDFLERYGYSSVETNGHRGTFVRYIRTAAGISEEQISKPQSRYEYRVILDRDSRNVFARDHFEVVDRETGEKLGEVVRVRFAGGWLHRTVATLWNGDWVGGSCALSDANQIPEVLIPATLIPTGKEK